MLRLNADAVFEGGGVKGIAFIGAIQVMEEEGYRWQKLAGTSAGSIIASLLSAGYNGDELYAIFKHFDFASLLERRGWRSIPLLGPLWSLLTQKGIYPGQRLEQFVDDLLRRKGIRTFGDLPPDKLKIIVSDISEYRMLVLPDDLVHFQLNPLTFPIARAVRMSSALPYFFQPVLLRHAVSKNVHYLVDGGLLSNFPVWLFDVEQPRWPTFGFRLSSPPPGEQLEEAESAEHEEGKRNITGLLSYSKSLLITMLEAHDRLHVKQAEAVRTIFIPTRGIRSTQFRMSPQMRENIYRSGRAAAERFVRQWDYAQYLKTFRTSTDPADKKKSGCS